VLIGRYLSGITRIIEWHAERLAEMLEGARLTLAGAATTGLGA
jgi:hypothetical protein